MLKKVFSVVLCVVLTCTMLSAFAAAPAVADIQTTTAYVAGSTTDITVTTTVSNVTENATYTYLAHAANADLDNLQPGDVTYVDEKIADENSTTLDFEYVTSNTKVGSVVRVSGTAGDTITEPAPNENYTVSVNGGETASGYVDLSGADNAYVLIEATLTGKVESVTVNDVEVAYYVAANGVQIQTSCFDKENANVIAITTGETENAYIKTEGLGITADGTAVIAMAQIKGAVSEFGIQFSNNQGFSSENDQVLWTAAALGKGSNGRFAVKVNEYVGDEAFAADATVYARAYYKIGENFTFGKTWAVAPKDEVVE